MAMSLGRQTEVFWTKIQIFWNVTVWHWGNSSTHSEDGIAFKIIKLFTQWYKVTPLNTWIISNTTAKTSNLATNHLYTCPNYLNGKNNNVPKTWKIPDRHVKFNPLLCQSHHLGAEHTIKGIMAGQTPLLSSSRGHKEQRGTIASNTPLPSSSWKLALRSAPLNTTCSVLKSNMYTAGFRTNPIQKTIPSKYWVMLSPIRCHASMHQTGGQSLFHSIGLQHESNMASLESPSTCLHSHIPTNRTTIIKLLSLATQQQIHKSLPQPG